jgi:hypothetical protein
MSLLSKQTHDDDDDSGGSDDGLFFFQKALETMSSFRVIGTL